MFSVPRVSIEERCGTHLFRHPADYEPPDPFQVVFTMVRIHLIRCISADEMQHRQLSSRMVFRPSSEVQDLVVVDDEVFTLDDPFDDFGTGNDPVRLANRLARRRAGGRSDVVSVAGTIVSLDADVVVVIDHIVRSTFLLDYA